MSMRVFSISRKVFRTLRHDKRTLALMLVAPLVMMSIFSLAFAGDVEHVKVVVVNLDKGLTFPNGTHTSFSDSIIKHLDKEKLEIYYEKSISEGENEVKEGRAWGVIIFPENFTYAIIQNIQMKGNSSNLNNSVSSANNSTLIIRVDNSNTNIANTIYKEVSDAVLATLEDTGRKMPLEIDTSQPIYGKNNRFIDSFAPGIITFMIWLLTTLLTLLEFVGERTSGTLDRLLVSPIKEWEIVLGYAIAFGIMGCVQAGLLIAFGVIVFDISVVGNIVLAFFVAALLALVSVNLGILLSSAAKNEAQAVQFIPMIIAPAFLLAGIFWPIEAIPEIIRPLSYIIPPTYAVDAMRSVMVRGWGLDKIWKDIVILLFFVMLLLIASVQSLKRRRA
ncbi:MAG: ABC transporter permease [Thermoplasmata archaeon]